LIFVVFVEKELERGLGVEKVDIPDNALNLLYVPKAAREEL